MLKSIQKYLKTFEEILFWGIVFLLIFVPLYQKFPLVELKGSPVAIRLEDFLILFYFIFWTLYVLISGKWKVILKNRLTLLVLLFLFVGFLSSFSAFFLKSTVSFSGVVFHFLRRVELLSFLLFPLALSFDKRRFSIFIFVFLLVVFVADFYGFGQRFLRFPAVSTVNTELSKGKIYYLGVGDRVNSTFAGHYDLAVFLMMSIILIFSFIIFVFDKWILIKKKKYFTYLLVLLFLFLFSFYILVITAARLSFLALVLGVFALIILLRKKKLLLISFFAIFLFFLFPSHLRERLILTFVVNIKREWSGYQPVNEIQERRNQLNIPTLPIYHQKIEVREGISAPDIAPGEPEDLSQLAVYRSFEIRTKIEWPRAIRAFLRDPLLGSGYSSIGLATDNDFLRLLGEVGVLGFISFVLLLFFIWRKLFVLWKGVKRFDKYYVSAILSLFLAFVFNAILIDVFEATKVASLFWLLIGVTLAYYDERKYLRLKDYEKDI